MRICVRVVCVMYKPRDFQKMTAFLRLLAQASVWLRAL
jgi:hypothetical protein